jgi:hypothetical protein
VVHRGGTGSRGDRPLALERGERPTSLEENLDGTPEDDDLNYTLLAMKILEQHGAGFGSDDVAQAWLLDLPAGRTFTAERVAYRNLLDGYLPPATARVHNPFREWIGAQIRTDLYGWVNPGDALRAAEWAWRDAAVSHTRNGIYGAMYAAALGAYAVVADSVEQVLDAAASVVPPASRLARAIRLGRELADADSEPTVAYARLEEDFAHLHWVHTLNNAALLTYALAAGRGDFDRTICLTVMGGWGHRLLRGHGGRGGRSARRTGGDRRTLVRSAAQPADHVHPRAGRLELRRGDRADDGGVRPGAGHMSTERRERGTRSRPDHARRREVRDQ